MLTINGNFCLNYEKLCKNMLSCMRVIKRTSLFVGGYRNDESLTLTVSVKDSVTVPYTNTISHSMLS